MLELHEWMYDTYIWTASAGERLNGRKILAVIYAT